VDRVVDPLPGERPEHQDRAGRVAVQRRRLTTTGGDTTMTAISDATTVDDLATALNALQVIVANASDDLYRLAGTAPGHIQRDLIEKHGARYDRAEYNGREMGRHLRKASDALNEAEKALILLGGSADLCLSENNAKGVKL
jgi:hypothetical protein